MFAREKSLISRIKGSRQVIYFLHSNIILAISCDYKAQYELDSDRNKNKNLAICSDCKAQYVLDPDKRPCIFA